MATNLFQGMSEKSKAMNERNDCSVKAVAIATGVAYEKIHLVFRHFGRGSRKRTAREITSRVINALGYEMVNVTSRFNAKTVTTLERQLPSRGIFIIFVRGHMLCARGGKVHDWTRGRRHRIQEIYRLVRKKDDNQG